jgi:uncharacterized protein YciI/ribosomal protein S18 acetylase RimI-like enzyme
VTTTTTDAFVLVSTASRSIASTTTTKPYGCCFGWWQPSTTRRAITTTGSKSGVTTIPTTTSSLLRATGATRTSVDSSSRRSRSSSSSRKNAMSDLDAPDQTLQPAQQEQPPHPLRQDYEEEDWQLFDDSLHFRLAQPNDIPECFAIESASYPSDEMATLQALTYRQAHATEYFVVVEILLPLPSIAASNHPTVNRIIGFCCATRCAEFTEESMSTQHDPTGPMLAIHSVVIQEDYRRRGIASRLLRTYIEHVQAVNTQFALTNVATTTTTTTLKLFQNDDNDDDKVKPTTTTASIATTIPTIPAMMESIVLLSKSHLLGFYVNCGFAVIRPSPIVHGKELWYDLERKLIQTLPITTISPSTSDKEGRHCRRQQSWFIKTEQFCKPFPQVQPHLKAHVQWVQQLRATGTIGITSGYRVDAHGKPGGGGFMILAANSYQDAMELVLQDPLIVNECVTWELNGWIGQVGNIQLR